MGYLVMIGNDNGELVMDNIYATETLALERVSYLEDLGYAAFCELI